MASVTINMQTGETKDNERLTIGGTNNADGQETQPGNPPSQHHPMSNGRGGTYGQINHTEQGMEYADKNYGHYQHSGKVVDSGSILGTARNRSGNPNGELTDMTIISLPDGFGETNIATAIHLGYLERDGRGGYREVPRDQHQQPALSPKAEAQAQFDQVKDTNWKLSPLDPGVSRAFGDMDMVYGEDFTDSVVALAIGALASETEPDLSVFDQYASRARMEPSEFKEMLDGLLNGFADQAARHINRNYKNQGVDGHKVLDWLTSGVVKKSNLQDLLFRHIYHKDLTVYDDAVRVYLANKDDDDD